MSSAAGCGGARSQQCDDDEAAVDCVGVESPPPALVAHDAVAARRRCGGAKAVRATPLGKILLHAAVDKAALPTVKFDKHTGEVVAVVNEPIPKKSATTKPRAKRAKESTMQQCCHCTFKCARTDTLQRHMMFFHNADVAYRCSLCQYRTNTAVEMRKHVSKMHGGRSAEFGRLQYADEVGDEDEDEDGDEPSASGGPEPDVAVPGELVHQVASSSSPALQNALFPHSMFAGRPMANVSAAGVPIPRRRRRPPVRKATDAPKRPRKHEISWKDRLVSTVRARHGGHDEHDGDDEVVVAHYEQAPADHQANMYL